MRNTLPRAATHSGRRAGKGFTLVEVLIAIVLINVGLLALVAGSAVLIRQTTEVRTRAAAMRVAANRIEMLGATRCAAANGDTAFSNGMNERWSADSEPNSARELRDSVTFPVQGAIKTLALHTRLPC